MQLEKNTTKILHSINLNFRKGEFYGILGHSGSGKTSFLRVLNRLDSFTEGEIWYKGQTLSSYPVPELRRKIAMLFQNSLALPGSVRDNFEIIKDYSNIDFDDEKIYQVLASVNLEKKVLERDTATLSGGELQRIALARVLLNEPEVLLLDEPTASLDEENHRQILYMIDRLRKEKNITIIMVTHKSEDISLLQIPFILFENGEVIQEGAYHELKKIQFTKSGKGE